MDFSAVDVEDLVARLDLGNPRLTSGGVEVNFDCFGPEHSDGGSAYINVETTAWFCHGCKRRGNALGLVMEVRQESRPTAERTLRDWYGIEFMEPIGGSMVAETEARFREKITPPDPVRPPSSWLSHARIDWESVPPEPFQQYMLNRGFDPSVLKDWDIGYDYISDRVTIPIFDVDGELVGIKGRDWTGERQPKYFIFGDREGMTRASVGFQPYEASQVVFGLHRHRQCRTVVILEGELNAIALSQLGVQRSVAIGMSYFTDDHLRLIVQEAEEAIVYLDHGQAGYEGMWGRADSAGRFRAGVVQMLEPYMRVRVATPIVEDPSKLLELGRGPEALSIIENATSSLTARAVFA